MGVLRLVTLAFQELSGKLNYLILRKTLSDQGDKPLDSVIVNLFEGKSFEVA